jgi:hypothetical protein
MNLQQAETVSKQENMVAYEYALGLVELGGTNRQWT